MATPINPAQVMRYVLAAERELPPEQQTVCLHRVLSITEFDTVSAGLASVETYVDADGVTRSVQHSRVNTMRTEILRAALTGWERFDVPFRKDERRACCGVVQDTVPDATLSQIGAKDRHEIAEAIWRASQLSETDRKN